MKKLKYLIEEWFAVILTVVTLVTCAGICAGPFFREPERKMAWAACKETCPDGQGFPVWIEVGSDGSTTIWSGDCKCEITWVQSATPECAPPSPEPTLSAPPLESNL